MYYITSNIQYNEFQTTSLLLLLLLLLLWSGRHILVSIYTPVSCQYSHVLQRCCGGVLYIVIL